MRQATTLMISLSLYLGGLFLMDSALASGHKGGEGHDHDRGKNPATMLFRGIDMTKQGDAIKKDTREQLAGVLDDEQMSQFENNAKRMNRAKKSKGKKHGHKKRNKMNKHGKGGKGHKHKKKGNKPKNRGDSEQI